MLEPDSSADEDQREVVVEDVGAERDDDHEPPSEGDGDEEEPREAGGADVAPGGQVKPK